MVKSALLILSGNAAAAGLLLIRNLLVAALIPVADYGIAATFAIAMAVVEMASTFGLQQQIVQSTKGEDPRFQSALQGFQVMRGVLAGLVLFALAGPIAVFMGIPEVVWAYRVLAVVPVFNALQHFDMHRLNRSMVFGPLVLTGTLPALVSLLAIWPLAAWLGDYRVMLWAVVIQAGVMMMASHLVAQRPYRLVWDRAVVAGSLRFGWPLLLNGVLLFVVFQGDKIIVGRALGMEALALLAMGVTLTLTPTLVMAKSAQNFFLPQLSRAGDDFATLAQVTLQVALLNGMVLIIGVAALGGPLVVGLLGAKYAALVPLLVPLAVVQAVRVAKAGPAVVALSKGQTSNAMWGNLPRVISLIAVWFAVIQGAGLGIVIWIATAGEVAGLIVALILMHRRVRVQIAWPPLVAWGAFCACAVILSDGVMWAVLGSGFVIAGGSMTALRSYVRGQKGAPV